MPRRKFNPKRRIRRDADSGYLACLARSVKYTGSPYHKRNPGDFGLTPPSQPRPDKTLCDGTGITTVRESLRLLREGIRKGLISENVRGEFPQNVWAVSEDGIALEAQLENAAQGAYHAYPMSLDDDFRNEVLKRWNGS